jgi:hypothetical protein
MLYSVVQLMSEAALVICASGMQLLCWKAVGRCCCRP